jgi:hypothetical protein
MLSNIERIYRAIMLQLPGWFWLLLAVVPLVLVDWFFLGIVLHYDFMAQGDVFDYWQDSLNWREPYNSFHMPGYAFTIAVVRWATGGLLSPTTTMLVITLGALSLAVVAIHQLAGYGLVRKADFAGFLAVGLFVLWPMVGISYVAYPIADMFGMAPLLIAIWLFLKKKSMSGGLILGLTLISHKAMWPFAGLIMVAHLANMRTKRSAAGAFLMMVPLTAIWILGAFHHDETFWLVSSNLDFEFKSTSSLPVLDGLVGSMLYGGVSGLVKGLMVAGIGLLALVVIVRAWKSPAEDELRLYSLAIGVGVLALVVLLNEREAWATVRFGRLLAVPVVWYFGTSALESGASARSIRIGAIGILLCLLASQFAFSYYMARVWTYTPL